VLPSRVEVYGLVAIEALAGGLHAVISTRAGVFPDVEGMEGVFGTDTEPPLLAAAMRASRAAWRGPIEGPPVMGRSPEAMAAAVLRAVEVACSSRRSRARGGVHVGA
jgi:hypothetical protein